ncbi:MAG: A/G-specific adenine glycosylase [Schleiferiaceae bacterium]|nr:A/G-specific adenine glycosylase [Schleiferiaceae bacterium]
MALFSPVIQDWYAIHKRDLPWRNTNNPYLIWLSEVILQQTRVNQGMAYFDAFANAFPTVEKLANASEDEVLKLWQGLGYYSRARNLHAAAKFVAFECGGVFPNSFKDIQKLQGVGPYTAAAVASFAFDLPHAVVDGNVFRVISRYLGVDLPIDSTQGKKHFQQLADDLLDRQQPALHNQAIMEFGALQCTPKNPDCNACPLKVSCSAWATNTVQDLPVKSKKTAVRHRYFNYIIPIFDGFTFLKKRSAGDIWEGLWEFPLIEQQQQSDIFSNVIPVEWDVKSWMDTGYEKVHKLSHQHLHCRFLVAEGMPSISAMSDYKRVLISDLKDFPVPVLLSQFIELYIIPLHLTEK